jgi:hypothetical protein
LDESTSQFQVPGAGFNFVLAAPEPEGGTLPNLGSSPEALVVHLHGGKLAVVFDDAAKILRTLDSLKRPVCAFEVEGRGSPSAQPVALCMVPKSQWIAVGGPTTSMQWVENARR